MTTPYNGLYVNYKSTQTLMNRRFLAVSLCQIAHVRSWSGAFKAKTARIGRDQAHPMKNCDRPKSSNC